MRTLYFFLSAALFLLQLNSYAINFDYDLGTLSPGGSITRSGTTIGFGNEYYRSTEDVSFRIYVPSSYTITINTCGSSFDTYLHLVNSADQLIISDDDSAPCGGYTSQIIWQVSPGYYYIVVEGYGSSGNYVLNVSASGGSALPAISINSPSVNENGGTAVFTVSLNQTYSSSVTGNFATSNGSAMAGSDFYQTSGSFNIAAGTQNTTISVQIIDDVTVEGNEAFSVILSNVSNATIATGTGICTLVDNEVSLSPGSISIGNITVTPGNSPGTFANVASASGGNGTYSYQWQQSTDGSSWTSISGATTTTYTVPSLSCNAMYRRMVTSGSETAYTNQVQITVSVAGGSISIGSTTVCSGSSPGSFANAVSPSGGICSYAYQWQQSADGINWVNINGATASSYTVPSLTASTYFRRVATSGSLAGNSSAVQITVTTCGGSVTSVNGLTGAVVLGLTSSSSGTNRTIGITNGTGTTIDVADNDNSSTNELQSLSISGSILSISGSNSITLPSSGSVTNVGLSLPGIFTVSGSPVTTSGTLAATLASQGANLIFAAPNGASGTPSFRALASSDVPVLDASKITTGQFGTARLGSGTANSTTYLRGDGTWAAVSGGSSQWTTNANSSIQYTGGNVAIGTSATTRNLSVFGNVYAKEVQVTLSVPAPDYVFGKGYNLRSLNDLKKFIDANKHLPEVPSAKEMEENGIGLSEMNLLLLKKIEELTLYILEQDKRIEKLENASSNSNDNTK